MWAASDMDRPHGPVTLLPPLVLMERVATAFVRAGYLETGPLPGCNGPHGDPETPLRNTAHWAILFCRLHELTGGSSYRRAANRLVDRIADDEAVAAGRVPVLRTSPHEDKANGIIGAAWLIEALAHASIALERPALAAIGARLAGFFPFDRARGLWCTREPDRRVLGVDGTLNHQIWFAMAAAMLPALPASLDEAIDAFVASLPDHLGTDGALPHPVASTRLDERRLAQLTAPLFNVPFAGAIIDRLPGQRGQAHGRLARMYWEKETGYLIFTLNGLARLESAGRSLASIRPRLARAYAMLSDRRFGMKFSTSRWAFGYNPPGFEFPIVARAFGAAGDLDHFGAALYREQLERTFDPATDTFSRGTADAATLTARLYSLSLARADEFGRLAQRPSI